MAEYFQKSQNFVNPSDDKENRKFILSRLFKNISTPIKGKK